MRHHVYVTKWRGRWWLGVALFAVLAAVAVGLGIFLRRHGFDWAAKFSEVASFAVALAALVLPVAARIILWQPVPRIKDEQVANDVNDLAAALRARGRIEAVAPGVSVYDRLPMPIRWEPAQELTADNGQPGTFNEVLEYFRQLPEPRLVILGDAGAGKTVLAIELARRLLADRDSLDAVPVIVPAAAWDPDQTALFTWIAEQLVRINADLGQKVSDGRRVITRAQVLVDRMKVLPILDGLDEVAESSRPTATLAINRYGWSQPLVVTCRTEDYQEIIGKQHGTPVARAAVIHLMPLGIEDIKGYLGSNADGYWTAIYDRLDAEPHGPLAQTLANPLMLWLTWAVYKPGGRTPDELADRYHFHSQEAIESYLLAEFIPTIYPDSTGRFAWPLRWPGNARRLAERWLGFLASDSALRRKPTSTRRRRRQRHLDTFETRDIQNVAWWRFTVAAGYWRAVGVLVRGTLLVAVLWLQVLRILNEHGNWRNGTYVGHLPFREVFLNGPLGQAVWPMVDRSIQLVPAKTRAKAFITLNNVLRDILKFPFHHPIITGIVIVLVMIGYVLGAEERRPRRIHFRPELMIRWLASVLQGMVAFVLIILFVMLIWHKTSDISTFFGSRATWVTLLALSLAGSVYAWPRYLVSETNVVGATTPLQSLRADRWAGITTTTSRRALFAVTLALLCGPQIALIYVVFAVASTIVAFTLGGLSGYASCAYTDACFWLAIRRKLPWRPMRFLIDAERRGVFHEIGAIYRFRHSRVQLELRDRYLSRRRSIQDWLQRLVQWTEQMEAHTNVRHQTLAGMRATANSYRELASQNIAEFGPDLTSALRNEAKLLRATGRRYEELIVYREIVATLRKMVEADPRALSDLAEGLEDLAKRLAAYGREYEALGVMSEAAEVYRHSDPEERDRFQWRLANWLLSLPFDAESHAATTPALVLEISRVADICADLVVPEPTTGYTQSLVRLAMLFQSLGQEAKAADAIKEAAGVHRELIRTDLRKVVSPRAGGLIDFMKTLEEFRLPDEAVSLLTDAVKVYRELARSEPRGYRADLAALLARLAGLLGVLGRPQELDAIREAVGIYREAAEGGPDGPADLSLAVLNRLAVRLWKRGERDAAIEAAQTGRRLAGTSTPGNLLTPPFCWEPLTEGDKPPRQFPSAMLFVASRVTGNPYWKAQSAIGWAHVADEFDTRALRFLASARAEESLAASEYAVRRGQQVVEIYRQLAHATPSIYLKDLAESWHSLAVYLRKAESSEGKAQAAADKADEIRRRLGLSRPQTRPEDLSPE